MILVFDTYGGLVNQFYDIHYAISFCNKNKIYFSFRNCAFRNKNLDSWEPHAFEKLFDVTFFKNDKFYLDYNNIKNDITEDNCENFKGDNRAINSYKNTELLKQFTSHNKKYVVLKQCWSVFIDSEEGLGSSKSIFKKIQPSKMILQKYIEIRNKLLKEPYNFIHYRYETDFTSHFNVKINSIDNVIRSITFKKNNLKTFIAAYNIQLLIDSKNEKYKNIIFKDDNSLSDLNFEQKAFIDYLFGVNSVECYGNKNSSFSHLLNNLKNTSNYYT